MDKEQDYLSLNNKQAEELAAYLAENEKIIESV